MPGWAVGGGHSLHVVCDMTIASKGMQYSSRRTPMWRVLTAALGRLTSHAKWGKSAREIFFLGASYSAQEAYEMGMVNAVILPTQAGTNGLQLGENHDEEPGHQDVEVGFNLIDDGLVGQQVYAGEATRWPMAPRKQRRKGRLFGKTATRFLSFPQVPLTEPALPFGHEHGPIVLFGFDGIGNVRLQPESEGDLVFKFHFDEEGGVSTTSVWPKPCWRDTQARILRFEACRPVVN